MTQSQEIKWYKIGEVARQLDIAVETIRMYERSGLFIPEKTKSGQRTYNDSDIHWLSCIRRMITELGMNIQGIRMMLALMPCWGLKPCSVQKREICPAFHGAIKPCWMIKDKIPESCRGSCRECNVYLSASRCENIKTMIYNIKDTQNNLLRHN